MLEPLDYRNILDYLEYHRGTNQETVDEFYEFFMPYLDRLLSNGNYKKYMGGIYNESFNAQRKPESIGKHLSGTS